LRGDARREIGFMAREQELAGQRTDVSDGGVALEGFLISAHKLANAFGESSILGRQSITVGEWAVLDALCTSGELSLREVISASGVSRQRINKLLGSLEAKRLVTVQQTEEGDRRRRRVAPTNKAARVREEVLSDFRKLLGALGTPGQEGLNRRLVGLARLSNRLIRALKQHGTA
jgi:DNA-binding MarR family transcriptional regulator